MDDLTREFLVESQEGLDRMERCLTELEARPGDAELVAEIFRAVHTIKGTTGFLGFRRLEKLAHAGENLLGQVRDGRVEARPTVIGALLELLDGLRVILKLIEAEGAEAAGDDSALIARLEALDPGEAGKLGNEHGDQSKGKSGKSRASRSQGINRRGRQVAVQTEAATAKIHDTAPGVELTWQSVESVAEPAPVSRRVSAPVPAAESTLRVDVELLNRMMNLVGELVLTRNQILQTISTDARTDAGADAAMTMLARRLDIVTADLREAVMKARMQPVSHIFSKMPRLVRDLSQTLGRRVRLELQGQETEFDKGLLEAIKDPLTHAVRNALDHGIEPPEKRAAAGKDPEGTLTLRGAHEGSHVIVEVADDGAGISPERVRARIVERGFMDAARAGRLSERELLQMVFLPGFSTATAITSVSGRGVGMDVVRANVEKIGGTVELDSRPGEGTTLRMRIPLTLAIVPALIVRSGGQSFALPQAAIQELVHIPAGGSRIGESGIDGSVAVVDPAGRADPGGRVEWIGNAPLYRLRGRLLPLVFLDGLLGFNPAIEPERQRRPDRQRGIFIVVLDADGRRYGLAVDGLADPEEIVIKPLSPAVKEIGLFSAATVLGNGELALILDPGAIAASAGVGLSEDGLGQGNEDVMGRDNIDNLDTLLNRDDARSAASPAEAVSEYLLAEAAGRRAAVPLAGVARIERVRAGQIEYAAGRPVLFEGGHLLPINDSFGVLAAAGEDSDAALVIVVCHYGSNQSGLAVSRVLDVTAGQPLMNAATGCPAGGVVLLKGKVTEVVDLFPDLGGEPVPGDGCAGALENCAMV